MLMVMPQFKSSHVNLTYDAWFILSSTVGSWAGYWGVTTYLPYISGPGRSELGLFST